jgi:hypothetical protein
MNSLQYISDSQHGVRVPRGVGEELEGVHKMSYFTDNFLF